MKRVGNYFQSEHENEEQIAFIFNMSVFESLKLVSKAYTDELHYFSIGVFSANRFTPNDLDINTIINEDQLKELVDCIREIVTPLLKNLYDFSFLVYSKNNFDYIGDFEFDKISAPYLPGNWDDGKLDIVIVTTEDDEIIMCIRDKNMRKVPVIKKKIKEVEFPYDIDAPLTEILDLNIESEIIKTSNPILFDFKI